MDAICYTCKLRLTKECDAKMKTKETRGYGNTFDCGDYKVGLFKDVADIGTNRMYHIINDFTHQGIETLPAKEAVEKYGECEWQGGYTTYDAIDTWLTIKED